MLFPVYLDEIAYDRVTIMRTKAVLGDSKLIDHHCDIGDMGGNSCAANYMEMYLLHLYMFIDIYILCKHLYMFIYVI